MALTIAITVTTPTLYPTSNPNPYTPDPTYNPNDTEGATVGILAIVSQSPPSLNLLVVAVLTARAIDRFLPSSWHSYFLHTLPYRRCYRLLRAPEET